MELAINNEIDRFYSRHRGDHGSVLTQGRDTAIFRTIAATTHRARDRQSGDLWLEMPELEEMKITSILLKLARVLHIRSYGLRPSLPW